MIFARPLCGLGLLVALIASPVRAEGVTRAWIGPEYFANRLQDWRLQDGRLECTEGRPRFPMRTLHWLDRTVSPRAGSLGLRVTIGALAPADIDHAGAWAGFLIGAGGAHVDHRLTALVHHRSAEDGGLLAVVDERGVVGFRDNTRSSAGGGRWSLQGGLRETDAVPIEATTTRRGEDQEGPPPNAITLTLAVRTAGNGRSELSLRAYRADTGALLSEARLDDVAAEMIDGGLALVSHGGGHWFDEWVSGGDKLDARPERRFGPVLGVLYTLSRGTLKLTAQVGPLGEDDTTTAALDVLTDGNWLPIDSALLHRPSQTFHFRVDEWPHLRTVPYRIRYNLVPPHGGPATPTQYEGRIRAEPSPGDGLVLGALSCQKTYTGGLAWNASGIWFPHSEIASAVAAHAPDLLYFAGDQIYEGDLTPAQRRPPDAAFLDYLSKWMRFTWAFGDLTRDLPTICVPDDHDVYHGNLWGAGGRRAEARAGMTAQDSGGYVMPPAFVNAVHKTQTSHLPDPVDPAPAGAGISVYFTDLTYGGVSFAILSDRQFKSSPTVKVPEGKVVNGWFQNPNFDPVTEADVPGAVLLGERQLRFLETWANDTADDVWAKAALSQTIFVNLATLPKDAKSGSVLPSLPTPGPGEIPPDHRLAADCDSGGWPQSGRNRALAILRRANAIHIAGDQHLGATVQYGIDAPGDAAWALSIPAIANTWPRRWFPPVPGADRAPGAPAYTGDFRDGFGNLMTVAAVANPVRTGLEPARLYDTAPGYSIVRFDKSQRTITFECWPRWVDPTAADARPFPGWPITVAVSEPRPR